MFRFWWQKQTNRMYFFIRKISEDLHMSSALTLASSSRYTVVNSVYVSLAPFLSFNFFVESV